MLILELNIYQKTNKNIIRNKKFTTNICRIQAYDSVMCGHFCNGIIDFMLKGKSLLDYINLYSPNDYGKNDKIILKLFKLLSRLKNYIVLFVVSVENWKHLRYLLVLSIICSECYNEEERIFKEKELIEMLNILGLIENI